MAGLELLVSIWTKQWQEAESWAQSKNIWDMHWFWQTEEITPRSLDTAVSRFLPYAPYMGSRLGWDPHTPSCPGSSLQSRVPLAKSQGNNTWPPSSRGVAVPSSSQHGTSQGPQTYNQRHDAGLKRTKEDCIHRDMPSTNQLHPPSLGQFCVPTPPFWQFLPKGMWFKQSDSYQR